MTDLELEIFERVQGNIPDQYEKATQGFFTYDMSKAIALEDAVLYALIENYKGKLDVTNLAGDELTRECLYRRGIKRTGARAANVELTITGTGTVTEGDLFATKGSIQFASIETKTISGSGTIIAECTEAGTVGMVGAGTITQIPVTIDGISAVTNPSASYEGYEEETDESLLERYLEDVQEPATSNNIYHFKKWAKEVSGVGRAKVFPTWNGNLTVKVAITNADMLPASDELVSDVQEYIDPLDNWGKGYGTSAIGSHCTIVSGTGSTCNISATITKSTNYTLDEINTAFSKSVTKYLQDIAFSDTVDFVSYAKLAALLSLTEGVLDVSDFLINGSAANVALGEEEVAVLGTVAIT